MINTKRLLWAYIAALGSCCKFCAAAASAKRMLNEQNKKQHPDFLCRIIGESEILE